MLFESKVIILITAVLLNSCYCRVVKVTCWKNEDCPSNASCESGHVCFCNDGYIDDYRGNTLICIREALKYGDECEKDIQCNALLGLRSNCHHNDTDNAVGVCVCNEDSHYKEATCHRNAFIGDKCKVSDDCIIRTRGVNAYCFEEKCICPPKHVPSGDKKDCVPTAGLGENCKLSTKCTVENSLCQEYCQCKNGYVASEDLLQCLKAAITLNDNCQEDSQCTEFLKFSRCDLESKKCACQDFTHRLNNQCWMTMHLGELCEYDLECVVEGDRSGVACINGFCTCKRGYHKSNQTCISIKSSGMDLSKFQRNSDIVLSAGFRIVALTLVLQIYYHN